MSARHFWLLPVPTPAPHQSCRPRPPCLNRPPPRNNLPVEPTPFIGRETELAALDTLLTDPSVRLLTIVAPGGMGKTRLAGEAARRQLTSVRFPDGIYFVSLAALDDPTLMAAPIADAIGFSLYVRDQREKWTKDDQADQLVAYLRHKKLLLVLDNLEHLLTDLKLLSSLIGAAPEVKILVTSRERLNVRSETALTLQGMVIPPDDTDVTQFDAQLSDAVQLFVLCAHRAHPAFVLSAENVPFSTQPGRI